MGSQGGRRLIEHKTWPSTNVSDIARLLSDDSACPHRVWFRSRYGSPWRAVEHGRGPAGENTGHTLVVHETAARLEQRGGDVFPQFRNGFEATGSVSGTRIAGRPDIVARHADGSVTVYIARTGEPEAVDEARVKLCMYLLPRSNHGLWRGCRMDGCVLYGDGRERRIGADEIDDRFRRMVAGVMRQIASDEPAPYVPSVPECGRCELTGDECGERIG